MCPYLHAPQIIGTRLNGLACCSSAAASNSFVKLSGCGAMPSGYPYEMSSGAPALWMCQVSLCVRCVWGRVCGGVSS